MTIKVKLNKNQTVIVREANQQCAVEIGNAAKRGAVKDGEFVFFAAFDGTGNDLSGKSNVQTTNVAQLWTQYALHEDRPGNCGGKYYAGPGSIRTQKASAWWPPAVTKQVIKSAENAYRDFTRQACAWLVKNPAASVTVVLTAFSRGVASAAFFSQIVHARGLQDRSGKKHAVKISAGVMFDPVLCGVSGNLAFAPNVGNVVIIQAANEYRHLFKAADYSVQGKSLTMISMFGNHCDIGGGYDNGIGAQSLDAATTFLQNAGLAINAVPRTRRLVVRDYCIHDESIDDYGNRIWDTYHEFSFESKRLSEGIALPAAKNEKGVAAFTMYDALP